MSGAQSISTRRAYDVCSASARTKITAGGQSVYARRQAPRELRRFGHRRGPVGAAPDEVLVGHIRRVLEAPSPGFMVEKLPRKSGRELTGRMGIRTYAGAKCAD